MTPLKMVTGLAPKFTTQALQMGPVQKYKSITLLENVKLEINKTIKNSLQKSDVS